MLKHLAVLSILTIAIDGVYLALSSRPFIKMIQRVQGGEFNIRWPGVIASYVIIVALIYKYIIMTNASLTDAFILGMLAYGLYDAVNYSLLNNWDFKIALQDTFWGGILFVLATWLFRRLMSNHLA